MIAIHWILGRYSSEEYYWDWWLSTIVQWLVFYFLLLPLKLGVMQQRKLPTWPTSTCVGWLREFWLKHHLVDQMRQHVAWLFDQIVSCPWHSDTLPQGIDCLTLDWVCSYGYLIVTFKYCWRQVLQSQVSKKSCELARLLHMLSWSLICILLQQ